MNKLFEYFLVISLLISRIQCDFLPEAVRNQYWQSEHFQASDHSVQYF